MYKIFIRRGWSHRIASIYSGFSGLKFAIRALPQFEF